MSQNILCKKKKILWVLITENRRMMVVTSIAFSHNLPKTYFAWRLLILISISWTCMEQSRFINDNWASEQLTSIIMLHEDLKFYTLANCLLIKKKKINAKIFLYINLIHW